MGRFLFLFLALAFFLVELEAKKRINKGNLRGWKPAFKSTPKPFKNQPPTSTTQSPQPLSSSTKPQLSTPNDKLLRLKLRNFRTTVEVGTPPQKLQFTVATSSPYTYISVTGCSIPNILGNRCQSSWFDEVYDPRRSKSSQFDGFQPHNLTDSLNLVDSNQHFPKFEFSASVCKDTSIWSGSCMAGGIGLSPQSLESQYSFVNQVIKVGFFSKPQASIHYKRCPFEEPKFLECPNEGEVVFGGVDTQNCALNGQELSVEKDATDWTFSVTNYTFIFNNKTQKTVRVGDHQTLPYLEGTITTNNNNIQLPTKIYQQLATAAIWRGDCTITHF